MTLPEGFWFSQSSLQDYVDCQRRFQLRHMLHLAWPAVEAEPYLENERRMDQGAGFHKLVHQYLAGIPEEDISRSVSADEVMQAWWKNFRSAIGEASLAGIVDKANRHFEEISLSVPIERFRLLAKFDLLLLRPDGQVTIFDWKTNSNHPRHAWLAARLQTHVYPFVLVGALAALAGEPAPDPSKVEMVYWFTNQPDQAEKFSYSPGEYQEDRRFLSNLVATIDQKSEAVYPLTSDVRRCLYCTYRSLCNRGVKPGDVLQMEDWQDETPPAAASLDFEQIGEIES